MILVDTDIMVDLLRGYDPAIAWLQSLEDEEVILPGFVVMELIQGCKNKVEQRKIMQALPSHDIVWPTPEVCHDALLLFLRVHLSHGIGILDTLIGQTAVAFDAPLCTFNQKHYRSIPALKTIEPYKK